jgi:hypothetical protein
VIELKDAADGVAAKAPAPEPEDEIDRLFRPDP